MFVLLINIILLLLTEMKFTFLLTCVKNQCHLSLTGMLDRCTGHFWFWGFLWEQLWAVLYQLCERNASLLFQPAHFQAGARGVSTWRHSLDWHRVQRQHCLSRTVQQEACRTPASSQRRMQVSWELWCSRSDPHTLCRFLSYFSHSF